MTSPRLEALKAMAEKKPDDAMIHYGLANEYKKAGEHQNAVEAFQTVVRVNPDYTAAYQELGSLLLDLGRADEARDVFARGIETADRTGAWKPREHMRRLLEELEARGGDVCEPQPDGFCE